jgi:hypothetical protein
MNKTKVEKKAWAVMSKNTLKLTLHHLNWTRRTAELSAKQRHNMFVIPVNITYQLPKPNRGK